MAASRQLRQRSPRRNASGAMAADESGPSAGLQGLRREVEGLVALENSTRATLRHLTRMRADLDQVLSGGEREAWGWGPSPTATATPTPSRQPPTARAAGEEARDGGLQSAATATATSLFVCSLLVLREVKAEVRRLRLHMRMREQQEAMTLAREGAGDAPLRRAAAELEARLRRQAPDEQVATLRAERLRLLREIATTRAETEVRRRARGGGGGGGGRRSGGGGGRSCGARSCGECNRSGGGGGRSCGARSCGECNRSGCGWRAGHDGTGHFTEPARREFASQSAPSPSRSSASPDTERSRNGRRQQGRRRRRDALSSSSPDTREAAERAESERASRVFEDFSPVGRSEDDDDDDEDERYEIRRREREFVESDEAMVVAAAAAVAHRNYEDTEDEDDSEDDDEEEVGESQGSEYLSRQTDECNLTSGGGERPLTTDVDGDGEDTEEEGTEHGARPDASGPEADADGEQEEEDGGESESPRGSPTPSSPPATTSRRDLPPCRRRAARWRSRGGDGASGSGSGSMSRGHPRPPTPLPRGPAPDMSLDASSASESEADNEDEESGARTREATSAGERVSGSEESDGEVPLDSRVLSNLRVTPQRIFCTCHLHFDDSDSPGELEDGEIDEDSMDENRCANGALPDLP